MKFTIRDLMLVTMIVAAASASSAIVGSLVGYLIGEARHREILEMERSNRFWDQVRIKTLEENLKDAGIPIPKKD